MDRLDKIEKYWRLKHSWTHPSYEQLKTDVVDLAAFAREMDLAHYAIDGGASQLECAECIEYWPCATRQALYRLNGGETG